MASHGTQKYRRSWVKYQPQDLKVIGKVWRECLGADFRPDHHRKLGELVEDHVSGGMLEAVREMVKKEFMHKQVYFIDSSNHPTEIPHSLAPLVNLALATTRDDEGFAYAIGDDGIYLGQRDRLGKFGVLSEATV